MIVEGDPENGTALVVLDAAGRISDPAAGIG
jgi:hypothetical protein